MMDPFPKSQIYSHKMSVGKMNSPRESQILTNSALEIIKTPTTFPLTTRIVAANYLTEHLPVRQSPLIELEEKLGLQIQHRAEATEI
jgi:hypothetical protein